MAGAGDYRHRLTYQEEAPASGDRAAARDAGGESVRGDWDSLFTIWAAVEAPSSRDVWAARQSQTVGTHTVRCRWSTTAAQMTAKGRFRWTDRAGVVRLLYLDGAPTNTDGRCEELLVVCREGEA